MRHSHAVMLAGALGLSSAACFNPSVRECAVTCNATTPCPSGSSCLLDGFCHDSREDSLCEVVDAGPMDAPLACGNGLVELAIGEECDDGNRSSSDGCSSACAEEPGFVCVEQPSQCRPNPAVAGDLVITELLANPSGPDGNIQAEWFEVHNPTTTDFDLKGMIGRDDGSEQFTVAASLVVVAGGHVVFGQSTDLAVNGGAPVDVAYGAGLLLSNAAGGDEVELVFGTTVIDRVTFAAPIDGAALSLSAATYDHLANDSSANFCLAVDPYGDNGDLGTPGALNPNCP